MMRGTHVANSAGKAGDGVLLSEVLTRVQQSFVMLSL